MSVLWRAQPRSLDVRPILQQAAASGRPDDVLEALRPRHPQYAALRAALRRYSALAAEEARVSTVRAGLPLQPGARSPDIAPLRARLALWGDLDGAAAAARGDVLDRPLVDALRHFQARHGLASQRSLDADTVAALNTSAADRVRQIVLNLERWRWQPSPATGRSVLVNVPTFELHAYADGREAKAGIASWIAFYNDRRLHQAHGYRTPMAVWRERMQAAKTVDMVDNADALTTCPQQLQQTESLAA